MTSPKRRRIESPKISHGILSEIESEIEIDIALKRQLADTLESRIAWALTLQETIKKGSGNASQETLRTVALDALSVVEHPSDYILCRDPTPPPSIHANRISRPPSKKTQSLNVRPKASFLYIRSNALVNAEGNRENHLYLLKCPGCSRTSFTSLQGLLNHARLTHGLEWGTHDECIRACAIVDNDLDVDAGVEVGVGPAGVLPALRTIFQNAVGQGSAPEVMADSRIVDRQVPSAVNHLVQTLGLHEESPALAPYLGKDAVRRQIKVWNEDAEVDLETMGAQSKTRLWKMPFAPRNFDDSAVNQANSDYSISGMSTRSTQTETPGILPKPSIDIKENVIASQSRFYFTTRVLIADRSFWVPPEQRPVGYELYTHKWMISVDSPSYTHHITTVLRSLRVNPCDPTHDISIPPPAVNPPFVAVGYSQKPFFARVELLFSGTGPDLPEQKVVFEHWVDLDPLNTREPSFGQEQVVDIELDRNTILMPRKSGYVPVGARSLWDTQIEVEILPQSAPKANSDIGSGRDDWQLPAGNLSVLQDAVKEFPMTLNSRKDKISSLPYKLVPSAGHFRALLVGRQKAIEWSRARAVQDAYSRHIRELEDPDLVALSVADVYCWLRDNGHFIREKKADIRPQYSEVTTTNQTRQQNEKSLRWCQICGIEDETHSATAITKLENQDAEDTKSVLGRLSGTSTFFQGHSCHIVPDILQVVKLPRLDVAQSPEVEGDEEPASPPKWKTLSAVDPSLTVSVNRLINGLNLPTFRFSNHLVGRVSYPADEYGQHRREAEKNLAVIQTLALSTEYFIRAIIQKGLVVANRDRVIASGLLTTAAPQRGVKKETGKGSKNVRILTPTHILSGILASGRGRSDMRHGVDRALLTSLSRLGVGVESVAIGTDPRVHSSIAVKMEE